jgi:hypothetical protein
MTVDRKGPREGNPHHHLFRNLDGSAWLLHHEIPSSSAKSGPMCKDATSGDFGHFKLGIWLNISTQKPQNASAEEFSCVSVPTYVNRVGVCSRVSSPSHRPSWSTSRWRTLDFSTRSCKIGTLWDESFKCCVPVFASVGYRAAMWLQTFCKTKTCMRFRAGYSK